MSLQKEGSMVRVVQPVVWSVEAAFIQAELSENER